MKCHNTNAEGKFTTMMNPNETKSSIMLTSMYELLMETSANGKSVDKLVREELEGIPELKVKYQELEAKLIEHGGTDMVYMEEPDLDLLLQDGKLFSISGVRMMRGVPNHCHINVLAMCDYDAGIVVCTGYGLDDDERWRQHSWLFDRTSCTIIETTYKFEKYFGIAWSKEAVEIMRANQ